MDRGRSMVLILVAAAFFMQCAQGDKITYHFPDTLSKGQRKELREKCDKGQKLFKIHCSECHGIFAKGKEKVPNFTQEQVDNYSARFLRHDPKNHAVTKEMSPDQMNEVLFFLRFRNLPKQTGKAIPPSKDTTVING